MEIWFTNLPKNEILWGFYRICGRVGNLPPLEWHVEDQKPEIVTISMRNMGLNEDKSAGLFFTLQGIVEL